MAMRTIVIGGGITGLVVAHRLRQQGGSGPVTLLEARDRCGGHATTIRDKGFVVEAGPNGFLAREGEPEPMALVRELGLEDSLIEASGAARRRFVLRGGKLRLVPSSPVSLFASDVLSPFGKLRLMLEPLVPPAAPNGPETVYEFARRRIGREAADHLVDAAVAGISAGDSRALDLEAAFPALPAMEREHGSLLRAMVAKRQRPPRLVSFTRGMGELVGALATRLEGAIRWRAAVRRIERAGGCWRVILEDGPALEAERVVLATSASAASPMLRQADAELSSLLDHFPQAGLAVVAMAFRAGEMRRPLDGYGYLVTRGEGLDTLGVVWESSLFAGRAPEGHVLVRAMLGGARRPDFAGLDEASLVARARAEIAGVMGVRVPPECCWVRRWPGAITQYTHGHLERVARVRARAATHSGLEFCGTSYDGISFTAAIVSAERAAARLLVAPAKARSKTSSPVAPMDPGPPSIVPELTEIARAD